MQRAGGDLMKRLGCFLRRHDWHSHYDHESKTTTWTCSRCGARKGTFADGNYFENLGRKEPDQD